MNLSGGKTRDGGSMIGGSVFYAAEAKENSLKIEEGDAIKHLDKELQECEQRRLEAEQLEQQLSSLVWICTSTQKMSKVTVMDANNLSEVLQVLNVCQSHLLCIASVPGAKESDYEMTKRGGTTGITVIEVHNCDEPNQDAEHVNQVEKKVENNLEKEEKTEIDGLNNVPDVKTENLEPIDNEIAYLGKVKFVKNAEQAAKMDSEEGDDAEAT